MEELIKQIEELKGEIADLREKIEGSKKQYGFYRLMEAGCVRKISNGSQDIETSVFTEDDLDDLVKKSDLDTWAIPLVLGRPEHGDAAVGWVAGLKRIGNVLYFQPKDLIPEFFTEIKEGRYDHMEVNLLANGRIRSISFYGVRLPEGINAL